MTLLRENAQICLIPQQNFFGADRILSGMVVSLGSQVARKFWCCRRPGGHCKVKLLRENHQICLIPQQPGKGVWLRLREMQARDNLQNVFDVVISDE